MKPENKYRTEGIRSIYLPNRGMFVGSYPRSFASPLRSHVSLVAGTSGLVPLFGRGSALSQAETAALLLVRSGCCYSGVQRSGEPFGRWPFRDPPRPVLIQTGS